jgi:tRNA A37 threonylcarbamoyladenosine modification protein TsaB
MQDNNKISILVISIANPILIGVYKNNILIDTTIENGKTSDILPKIFSKLLNTYKMDSITYINGPGSFMAIKVSYIFLRTICIVNNIKLFASSGFNYNNNSPIKALGKKYFFKGQDDKIKLDFLNDESMLNSFKLPEILNEDLFITSCEPNYNLPAVN